MDINDYITVANYDPMTLTCTTNRVDVGSYVVDSQKKIESLENELCELKYELNKLKFDLYKLTSEADNKIKKALNNMSVEYVRKVLEV
jgi:hypothetical protein